MKNNLDSAIEKIKERKSIGLMAHLVTGYPTLKFSKRIAETLVKNGADIIEIQIPFSDPMADGPFIVEACQTSLNNGSKVKDSFELATFVQHKLKTSVVLMTYANIVIHIGVLKFCVLAKKSGVSGIIVPDLPYDSEEGKMLYQQAQKAGIHIVYVVSPAVEKMRLKEISKLASGFIYCTSRQGTTGTGKNFTKHINKYLQEVSSISKVPIAVGFGISSSKDLHLIKKYARIGVVGSVIIQNIIKNTPSNILPGITKLMNKMK